MSYTVFGLRGTLGRAASHGTVQAVVDELASMRAAGFADLQVGRPYSPMMSAECFLATETRALDPA
ncbi:hypothetical protein [Phenylobacterium kunshanense]|uniref:Uncharacterized protein n=1 Tax=Phenylobacterium kunshanense TaxID=1445034 RepID=A0A328BJ36_9CAUL|nr:hypothetical protein [Phenylobacterium kunshanense]RAK67173.1 hypothetical protein DJ019_04330 [Phenylobacterium kunshanense]